MSQPNAHRRARIAETTLLWSILVANIVTLGVHAYYVNRNGAGISLGGGRRGRRYRRELIASYRLWPPAVGLAADIIIFLCTSAASSTRAASRSRGPLCAPRRGHLGWWA